MRYSVVLSYVGAGFCGWQRQPSDPSVQQTLEEALGKLLGADTPVIGAGRTDTGVNAIGYVACFDGPEGLAAEDFRYKLNAILPRSVVVDSIECAAPDFHPRFDARRREYTYFLHRCKDPFVEAFSWQCGYPELDFEAMNEAAAALLGTHDFSCFEKVGADNKTSVCTVFEAFWEPYTPTHSLIMPPAKSLPYTPVIPSEAKESYWFFRISADRFLRNMVRAIVGTLIEVGRGKRSVDDFAGLVLPAISTARSRWAGRSTPKISRFLGTPDSDPQGAIHPGIAPPEAGSSHRSKAGESVPGHALFLSKVEY